MSTITLTKPGRAADVIRVSKVHSRRNDEATGERFRSTEIQRSITGGVMEQHGLVHVETLEDLDQSGGTMDRPGMNAAMELLRSGQVDTLVFATVDRFTRNTEEGLATLREIRGLGGRVLFGDFTADIQTPEGWKMLVDFISNAELYRLQKGVQLKRTAALATKEGIFIGPAPTGYMKVQKKLVPDPILGPLITGVFERRAAGQSWSAIREWWHSETGEWIKAGTFLRFTRNRVYTGELTYAGVTSDWRHTELVSEELWQAAQSVHAPRPARSKKPKALLAGLILCSGCNRPMTPSVSHRDVLIYRCQKVNQSGTKCERSVAIKLDTVDEYVAAEYLAWAGRAEVVTTGKKVEAEFAKADAKIAAAERDLAGFLAAIAGTNVDPAYVGPEVEKRQAAIDEAKTERNELEAQRKLATQRYRAADLWRDGSLEDRRLLLHGALASVVVKPTSAPGTGGRRVPVADRVDLTWRAD